MHCIPPLPSLAATCTYATADATPRLLSHFVALLVPRQCLHDADSAMLPCHSTPGLYVPGLALGSQG
eukprot:3524503-Pyramimonas_sp.AAC.1